MDDPGGLPVGAEAPAFTAPLTRPDGTTEPTALADLLDERAVLLVFYTVDFSPDCIDEWCSFRDFDWFSDNDSVQVVGISKSGPYLHKRFLDYLDLGFPLFSDPDLSVARDYRVDYRAFKLFARARRSCFLIDRSRTVRYTWMGEHWLDATRAVPPIEEVHEAIVGLLDDDGRLRPVESGA